METRPRIRRRAVLTAGSAWAVPTLVVASPARAAATSASCSTPCPSTASMGFGGAAEANGWSSAKTGSFGSGTLARFDGGYAPWDGPETACLAFAQGDGSGGRLANAIVVEPDPTAPSSTITYRKKICLTSGYTYSFVFDYNYYGLNRRAAYLDAALVTSSGTVVAKAPRIIAPAASNGARNANGKGSSEPFSYAPTLSQDLQFVYTWSFSTSPSSWTGCDQKANDIAVTAPTIKCAKV